MKTSIKYFYTISISLALLAYGAIIVFAAPTGIVPSGATLDPFNTVDPANPGFNYCDDINNCVVTTGWDIDTVNDYIFNDVASVTLGIDATDRGLGKLMVGGNVVFSYEDDVNRSESLFLLGDFSDSIGNNGIVMTHEVGDIQSRLGIKASAIDGAGDPGDGSDMTILMGLGNNSTGSNYNAQITPTGFVVEINDDQYDINSPHNILSIQPYRSDFISYNGANDIVNFSIRDQSAGLNIFETFSNGRVIMPGLAEASGNPAAVCFDEQTGELFYEDLGDCDVSSERFKENITPLDLGLAFVNSMETHSFQYKNNPEITRVGFIAEEIAKLDTRLVFFEPDGETVRGVHYGDMTAVLVNAVQEMSTQLTDRAVDLIDNVRDLFVRSITVEKELCIGDTCIDESRLQELLGENDSSSDSKTQDEEVESDIDEGDESGDTQEDIEEEHEDESSDESGELTSDSESTETSTEEPAETTESETSTLEEEPTAEETVVEELPAEPESEPESVVEETASEPEPEPEPTSETE